MKTTSTPTVTSAIRHAENLPVRGSAARAAVVRPKAGARYADPLGYPQHPYPSMQRFAQLLALRYDMIRTRHSYYRSMRLIHEHCQMLLGHKHINTTMIYLHVTHRSEQDSRALVEKLSGELPR